MIVLDFSAYNPFVHITYSDTSEMYRDPSLVSENTKADFYLYRSYQPELLGCREICAL